MEYELSLDNVLTITRALKAEQRLTEENERLKVINAELLEACKVALNAINLNDETLTAREALTAVIAKGE